MGHDEPVRFPLALITMLVLESRDRAVVEALGKVRPERYVVPTDILAALRKDPHTWAHWCAFPAPYRRIRAAYVDRARDRPGEFEKRLAHLVRRTAVGKPFGYGIERFCEEDR